MCMGGGGGSSSPSGPNQAPNPAPIYHPAKDDPPEQFPTARPPNDANTPYRFSGRSGLAIPFNN